MFFNLVNGKSQIREGIMKNLKFISICFLLTLAFVSNSLVAMEVGVATVDITGDGAMILDPLNVKAVFLRQGSEQIAIAVCDVGGVSRDVTSLARQRASAKTGIAYSNICVAATHTHMAKPHKDLVDPVVEAIVKAQAAAKPVKLAGGIGVVYNVSFNRRYWMKNGKVMFNPMFLNPDIVCPAGPIDPEVGFVVFSDLSNNKPMCLLSNFALHLDTVKEYGAVYQKKGKGSRNSVSADYPYWLEESLRKDLGKDLVSVFTIGCCGNVNHWDFSKPGPQSGHKTKTKQIGEGLATAIKVQLPNAKEQKASLAARSRVIDVPLQSFTIEDLAWAKKETKVSSKSEEVTERKAFLNKVRKRRILALNKLKEKGQTTIALDVQVFRLSDKTAIVTLPGEMFVEHGLAIRNFSPFENTLVMELANDNCKYVPDRRAFRQGEYEVENSLLVPGGGEMLVEAAVGMLKELKVDIR